MNDRINVLIAIPTYNNRKTIREVSERCLKIGYPLLVINDGCTDGSMELIKDLDLHITGFKKNRGKGAAIQEAARWAEEYRYSHIITLDADAQHYPEEIPDFIEAIKTQSNALIIGSRDFSGMNIPSKSQFGRNFSNFWIYATSGMRVEDSQSGFRAYPVPLLTRMKYLARRYNLEMEVIVRAIWARLPVRTIPIKVVYSEETRAGSHFNPFMDNLRISLTYTYLTFRRFFPWPKKKIPELLTS